MPNVPLRYAAQSGYPSCCARLLVVDLEYQKVPKDGRSACCEAAKSEVGKANVNAEDEAVVRTSQSQWCCLTSRRPTGWHPAFTLRRVFWQNRPLQTSDRAPWHELLRLSG